MMGASTYNGRNRQKRPRKEQLGMTDTHEYNALDDDMPDGRRLARVSGEELRLRLEALGPIDWTQTESKLLTRPLKVSDQTKLALLLISKRTGLSPARVLAAAVEALLAKTELLNVPSPDEIHQQLVATTPVRHQNGS